jgi:Spy/CpxP family protein refolding chaperone
MKKLMLSLLMTGMLTGVAVAQEQKDMKQDAKEWDKKVKTELSLTDEQVAKYDAVCKEYEGKFDEIKKDASISKEAQKAKKMELKKEKQAKMFEFLTPDQQTKYTALVEQKKSGKEERILKSS